MVREPDRPDVAAQSDPKVIETVSEMLSDIERGGLEAVRRYAEQLDGWTGGNDFESARTGRRADATLPQRPKAALDAGAERTRRFAEMQRAHLHDFEDEVVPGVVCGQKYVPVGNVGAYLPAGRFPLLASAFMTVGVARAAGVPNIVCATPPSSRAAAPGRALPARASGAERVFALGGVQALAAMAFGLLDGVGVGHDRRRRERVRGRGETAAVRQGRHRRARRTLRGRGDRRRDGHGPDGRRRPAGPGRARAELAGLPRDHLRRARRRGRGRDRASARGPATREIAGAAWRDWGSIYVADSPKTAVEIMDLLAPEHLEILAEDTDFYLDNLHNYGSLFLGEWSTVAYADKGMSGTNHVLPTGPRRPLHRRGSR